MLVLASSRLLLCLLPIAIGASFFLPTTAEAKLSPAESPAWNALVVGPARGQIEPCGCSGGQLGGIDRVSTVLAMNAGKGAPPPKFAAGGSVALEAMTFAPWAAAQAEVMLQAYSALGFDAVGFGASDLSQLNRLQTLSILRGSAALICSNLTISGDPIVGAPAQAWSGQGLCMLSFLPAALAGEFAVEGSAPETTRQWSTTDPASALQGLEARGLWSPDQATIAFFEGSDADAGALAKLLSDDSMVLMVADEYEASEHAAAGTAILQVGSRLRQVLRLSGGTGVDIKERVHQSRVTEDVPGDETIGFLRGFYRMALFASDARASVADSQPLSKGGSYVGSDACAACHTDAYEIWGETLHHQALDTLDLDMRDGIAASFDPRCIKCHTVGFGDVSGFGSAKQPEKTRWTQASPLGSVGCESCHGPGQTHIQTRAPEDIERSGEYTCLECHDAENDPHFVFDERWDAISHQTPK